MPVHGTYSVVGGAGSSKSGTHERAFKDEDDLIRTVNPLLTNGSDVRDVLSHIESSDGFFYLLHLTAEKTESGDSGMEIRGHGRSLACADGDAK